MSKYSIAKCVDARRSQGTLELNKSYVVLGERTVKSKDGVMRDEVRVTNDTGNRKWYAKSRFEILMTSEELKTYSVSEEKEEKKESVKPMTTKKKMTLGTFLAEQGVSKDLIKDMFEFRKMNNIDETVKNRCITRPSALYVGGEVWSMAIASILEGHNILLEGEKATGKNVLAENLAFAFGRPTWDVSMHVNIDSSSLIGDETFKNGEVEFKPGHIYNVARYGGFGVLDEINMAKNEALAVLHAILDDRRVIDVPGYDRIKMHECSRLIATMNYGYVGTRELNEALVSRFVVISVPSLDSEGLTNLLKSKFMDVNDNVKFLVKLFLDLQAKAKNGEISTRSVDLRGVINALGLIDRGINPRVAVTSCIVNKAFDEFERTKVNDVVATLIPETWKRSDLFSTTDSLTVDFSTVKY